MKTKERKNRRNLSCMMILLALALSFAGCRKPFKVITQTPTEIQSTTAVCGGEVIVKGGDSLVEVGVCWDLNSPPKVKKQKMAAKEYDGSFSVTITGLKPNKTYYVRAYAWDGSKYYYGKTVSFITLDHDYVDLGLPSGTLWATCNVGANREEEYGDYFAWGETNPKTANSFNNYKYCAENKLTKYCENSNYGYKGFTDNLVTLQPNDDAATANWSSGWRMPTMKEWNELYHNTTITWTSSNNVYGLLATASNGNSLFLPAAGNNGGDAGSYGYYWSNELYTSIPEKRARLFFFQWVNYIYFDDNYLPRSNGYSVRAVRANHTDSVQYTITARPNSTNFGIVTNSQKDHTCTLTATTKKGYVFVNWTENDIVVCTDATYSFTVNSDRDLVANFSLNASFVDLGLPSGTLWATYNVGATTPENCGTYFTWCENKEYFNNYITTFIKNHDTIPYLTKYCNNSSKGMFGYTDNLTTLLPEDDAATGYWGVGWRIPSKEEWLELYNNTNVRLTTQNGVKGMLFTASNGKTLFLPAAGVIGKHNIDNIGIEGVYWSSSINTESPLYAVGFRFDPSSYGIHDYKRTCSFTVRAVCDPQPRPTHYTITAKPNSEDYGVVKLSQKDKTCTATATANKGYIFTSWSENGNEVSTDAIYSFTVNTNRTLDAVFKAPQREE